MSDFEIAKLRRFLNYSEVGRLYYEDKYEGVLVLVRCITDNHKDTDDPKELPETVAWIEGRSNSCIGLFNAELDDFKFMVSISLDFPKG